MGPKSQLLVRGRSTIFTRSTLKPVKSRKVVPGTGDPPGAVHDSIKSLVEKESITQCPGFFLGAIGCK